MNLFESLSCRTRRMQEEAFDGIRSPADWAQVREKRRKDFRKDLGLESLSAPCEPEVREYGWHSGPGFRVKKIGFQILPNCWASANVYYPDPMPGERVPAILYVCGHAKNGAFHYQHESQAWARRGYACLIVDTIEQSDNPGEHHGFQRNWQNLWLSLGYTSAGGETLNSLRALDVLASDPAVDPERLGITGISGGGAVSLYVGILDERIAAVSSVCGVSTPFDAIANRRMMNHCDCIYPFNLSGRDIAAYAALIAPRALMLCFGDNDALFHPDENRALGGRVALAYELCGASEKFQLTTGSCGHENHPEFFKATQEWFDKHVAGSSHPLVEHKPAVLSEAQVCPFQGTPPTPNYLHLLPEMMNPRGRLPLPEDAESWPALRTEALDALPRLMVNEPEIVFQQVGRWSGKTSGVKPVSSAYRGRIAGMELWIDVEEPQVRPGKLLLSTSGGGEFTGHLPGRLKPYLPNDAAVLACLEPRLGGINFPAAAPDPLNSGALPRGVRNRAMFALILTGQTPVMMTIRDIRASLDYLLGEAGYTGSEVYLHGSGDQAVASLYAGIVDPRVAGVILEDLPASHAEAAPIPGILRTCDLPEALGLMAPRKVVVTGACHGNWTYSTRVFERLGCPKRLIWTANRGTAFHQLLGNS